MRWVAVVVAVGALLVGCKSELEQCLSANAARDESTTDKCERAWQRDHDISAAVAGAQHALGIHDDRRLSEWADRAPRNIEGARILYFWSERLQELGHKTEAESLLRQTLALRVDNDPLRATNTALALFALARSDQPAEESIKLIRLAWRQAVLARDPTGRMFAATDLIDVLLDLGELHTAELVFKTMVEDRWPSLRDLSEGRLESARGRFGLAASLFERARKRTSDPSGHASPTISAMALVEALLASGQISAAARAMDDAGHDAREHPTSSVNEKCHLATVQAEVQLAEGLAESALTSLELGLKIGCRDSPRAALLDVLGNVEQRLGRPDAAEDAWRQAADSIEAWRISLPSPRLRSGVLARHRRSLEAWLDSAASRGNAEAVIEIAERMLGRSILERILDRESDATGDADTLIGDVLSRITNSHQIALRSRSGSLRSAPGDLSVYLLGVQSAWLLRHENGVWFVSRIGDRTELLSLVDAYEQRPDDERVAAQLGSLLIPSRSLQAGSKPFIVLLDDQLTSIAFAGLRVDERYLVEQGPIVEVPAPQLLAEDQSPVDWSSPIVIGDAHGDLPDAAREATFVADALHVTARLQTEATRGRLLAEHRPRVLHIAVHSAIDGNQASFSLADGTVSATELLAAGLAPRVAVVATCRSDGGADPMKSLVAALLATGTRGVIGAKRAIDDRQTADLISDFYRAGGDRDPVGALAAAQRQAIARHVPPAAWASLSYFGSSDLGPGAKE